VNIRSLRSGAIDIDRVGDEIHVLRADPIVSFSLGLFVELCRTGVMTADGEDAVSLAGQVRYQLVGVTDYHELVAQRIDD
jgi:hypothetical protein